jgi:hypothetical protein
MSIFAVLVFVAAGIAVLVTLAMGLVNLTKAGTDADGEAARALRSNKLMQQRVIFQAIAIGALALLLFVALASKG